MSEIASTETEQEQTVTIPLEVEPEATPDPHADDAKAAASINIDDFLADMESSTTAPTVGASAINLGDGPEEERTVEHGEKDIDGTVFDPSLHAVNREGNPSMTSAGRFRRRRGMGTRSQSTVGSTSIRLAEQAAATAERERLERERKSANARVTGVALSEMWFKTCQLIGGADWQPIKNEQQGIDERAEMHQVMAIYCEAKDLEDLPVGVLLAFTMSAYALPRFGTEGTQTRFKKIADTSKRGWLNIKSAWSKRSAARANRRDNGKRKDIPGEADSTPEKGDGARDTGS